MKSFIKAYIELNGTVYCKISSKISSVFVSVDESLDFDLLDMAIFNLSARLANNNMLVEPKLSQGILMLDNGQLLMSKLIDGTKKDYELQRYFLFMEMMRCWVLFHIQKEDFNQLAISVDMADFTSGESSCLFLGFLLHDFELHVYAELEDVLSKDEVRIIRELAIRLSRIMKAQEQNEAAAPVEDINALKSMRTAHAVLLTDLMGIEFSSTATRGYIVCLAFLTIWLPTRLCT